MADTEKCGSDHVTSSTLWFQVGLHAMIDYAVENAARMARPSVQTFVQHLRRSQGQFTYRGGHVRTGQCSAGGRGNDGECRPQKIEKRDISTSARYGLVKGETVVRQRSGRSRIPILGDETSLGPGLVRPRTA
jgi:hypothetical protein